MKRLIYVYACLLLHCTPINAQLYLTGDDVVVEGEQRYLNLPQIKLQEEDVLAMLEKYVPIIVSTCKMTPPQDVICLNFYEMSDVEKGYTLFPINLGYGIPDLRLFHTRRIGYLKIKGVYIVIYGYADMSNLRYKIKRRHKRFKVSYVIPCEDGDSPYWLFTEKEKYIEIEPHPTDKPWDFMKFYYPYK